MEPLRFALLGLGAGAAYGLIGQGLVVVYRGAGIVNFAQGALGMIGALLFFELRDDHGLPLPLALTVTLVVAAALGGLVHILIMRPLVRATPVARLMSTLAIFVLLLTIVQHESNAGLRAVWVVLPARAIRVLPDTEIGLDRLILCGIACLVTLVLGLIYRRTRFGLTTTATAENTMTAQTLGIRIDLIAAANWAIACVLSTTAAILISSMNGQFDPQTLSFLVLPGLAAALVGRFESFPLALLGGLALGVVESEMSRYVTATGWANAGPFLVILVILVVRGRPLPLRGELTGRVSRIGSGRVSSYAVAAVIAVGVAIPFATNDWVDALTSTGLAAIVVLSLVIVVGYGGQISLAQYTLAGMAAWAASRLVASGTAPFPVAAALGVITAVALGLALGAISLRSRGVNLAVATLGAGTVLEQVILLNPARTGGNAGTTVGALHLFGLDVDSIAHPRRYAALVLLALVVLLLMARNVRRSTAGLRLLAVRGNERAAAAVGVGVFGTKLYAFAVGAMLAGVAGVLIAFRNPFVVFDNFTVLHSITAVMQAVVGGIGFLGGAVFGGLLEPGSAAQRMLELAAPDNSATYALALIGAAGALATLVIRPDGVASAWVRARRRVVAQRATPASAPTRLPASPSARLEVTDLTVEYGAVRAVDKVSVTVEPGTILGIVGPNGSGKTTFIDAVTGFARAASGSIAINGRDVSRLSAVRRSRLGLGRTFQSLELFPGMDVSENLQIAADDRRGRQFLLGLVTGRRPQLSSAIHEVIRALDLQDDLASAPDALPYGKRRLVSIARALAARPRVLMLDEPAAGLSPQESLELGELLRRIADEMGLAVILVEHDIDLVAQVCDQLIVLDRGQLISAGSPDLVLRDPDVERVYLGEPVETQVVDAPAVARPVVSLPAPTARSFEPRDAVAPVLQARGLDAGHGALAAVRGFELDLWAGEIVALLGPNGAGKTTTLMTLAGVNPPLAGQVSWQGSVTTDSVVTRIRRGLAVVPDERSVISQLSTADNLRLGRGETETALELFPELRPLLRRRGGLLSGGEQQMVALARALAARPHALLVDELSLGLAPRIVDRLYDALCDIAAQGTAVLLVEQYVHKAVAVADRIIVLNRGETVLQLSADAARSAPDAVRRAYLPVESDSTADSTAS